MARYQAYGWWPAAAAVLVLCTLGTLCHGAEEANYLIGRGIYDMTGPAGEINFVRPVTLLCLGGTMNLKKKKKEKKIGRMKKENE